MGAFFGFGLVALFAAGLLAVWGGALGRAWLPVGAAAIASFGLSGLLFFLGVRAERRAAEHGQCGCGPASAAWAGGAFLCYRLSDEAYDALRRGLDAGSYELRRAASLEEAERARPAGLLAGCVVGEWLPEDEWERLRQDFVPVIDGDRCEQVLSGVLCQWP